MNVQEFATAVLFGSSMADKLTSARNLDDDPATRCGISAPAFPSRPSHVTFLAADERRASAHRFPNRREMEAEEGRGRVMHFFANHELLALELMALMLLRFPKASDAFRRTLVQVMGDEQRHLSFYLKRMKELGVAFGDLKAGHFFWDCLKDAVSPLAFLSGMSLTFEQANLDFCLQYMHDMEEIGDEASRDILLQVYRDEIRHVAHGWSLFDAMRPGRREAFDEYCELLPGPLTPRHARGGQFFSKPREAAGLDESFIRGVEVFRASRSRRPDLFFFNANCEGEWLTERGPVPPEVQQVQRDLEGLPAFFASADDLLLVSEPPGEEFMRTMSRAGFLWPRCVTRDELRDSTPDVARLRPWGQSPATASLWQSLSGDAAQETTLSRGLWHRKSWSSERASQWEAVHRDGPLTPLVRPEDFLGEVAGTADEVDQILAAFVARGKRRLVIKADLGVSGRHTLRLLDEPLAGRGRRWLESVLREHGQVVVEPWLDRVADLSFHFDVRDEGTSSGDLVRFHADRRGQFLGAFVSHPQLSFPPDIQRLMQEFDLAGKNSPLASALKKIVGEALFREGYRGPVGVDMFFYRDARGELRLHPLVEVNPRWTMGRLALRLRSHVHRGAPAFLEIECLPSDTSAIDILRQREKAWPLTLVGDDRVGIRIKEGFLALVPRRSGRRFLAELWVGEAARQRLRKDCFKLVT